MEYIACYYMVVNKIWVIPQKIPPHAITMVVIWQSCDHRVVVALFSAEAICILINTTTGLHMYVCICCSRLVSGKYVIKYFNKVSTRRPAANGWSE